MSLFVTGHVRSGTSMVAGLFARHGVFFGNCGRPTRYGPKGHYENQWLKSAVGDKTFTPERWQAQLEREGWDGASPWGAKLMPMHWDLFKAAEPSVIVCCYREPASILASSKRMGWKRSEETVQDRFETMRRIPDETDAKVFRIWTPAIVQGRYGSVEKALDALGLTFDPSVAEEWVDPTLWHF